MPGSRASISLSKVSAGTQSSPPAHPSNPADELRALVQGFLRSFGVLAPDQTPCGNPLGLSHAHGLLVLLEQDRNGVTPSQQEVGRLLGIDKSNVTRLCRRMEDAGHLLQDTHAEDARARCLRLTPKGKRIALDIERASRDRFNRLLSLIPAEGRSSLIASLRALNGALAEMTVPPAIRVRR